MMLCKPLSNLLCAKFIRKIYPQNLSAKFIRKIYPQNLSAKSIREHSTEHFYYKQDLLAIGDWFLLVYYYPKY